MARTLRTSRGTILASLTFATASLVAVPVAGAAAPTGPTTDPAGTTAALARHKTRCTHAIDRRITLVKRDIARVEKATAAPAADRTELVGELQGAQSTLEKSKQAVQAADTAASLRTACKESMKTTRVRELLGFKTRVVLEANRIARADKRMQALDGRVDKIVERATKRGVAADRIAAARAAYADAKSRLQAAKDRIDALTEHVLAITPAQVNDGSAKTALADARTELRGIHDELRHARTDLVDARKDLRVHS